MLVGETPVSVLILDRTKMHAGFTLRGPAIVTQLDATTVIGERWHAHMDASGGLILEFSPE